MKNLVLKVGKHPWVASLTVLAVVAGAQLVHADAIPYPDSGTPNPLTYSFTATASGDVMAYFAGSTASYDNQLGMMINGIMSGAGFGLDNQSSSIGQSFNLGHVNAGDTLVFVLHNLTLGADAYSDPSLNVGYDTDGTQGHNHVYATPYTATSPVLPGVPTGTFVSFEDLRFPSADFNYNDEDFVFTDVGISNSVPETASSVGLLAISFAGLAFLRRRVLA
jgi:hypothetical protein